MQLQHQIQLTDYQGALFRRFTGKEKDSESGYYYFGARYFMPTLSSWLSVDPMADKYPSLSPYNYCAWNPIKLVDPNGDTVIVKGEQADAVVDRLQTARMKISIDRAGKLSVDIGKYKRSQLSKDEKQIFDAINSSNIYINIITGTASEETDQYGYHAFTWEDGVVYGTKGGSFMGSSYYESHGRQYAETRGFLDVNILDKEGFDQGVPHEISEQLLIGKATIKNRQGVGLANLNYINEVYWKAHCKAIDQRVRGHYISLFGIDIPKRSHSDFLHTQKLIQ